MQQHQQQRQGTTGLPPGMLPALPGIRPQVGCMGKPGFEGHVPASVHALMSAWMSDCGCMLADVDLMPCGDRTVGP